MKSLLLDSEWINQCHEKKKVFMSEQEMTLDQWIDKLPENHGARKELSKLRMRCELLNELVNKSAYVCEQYQKDREKMQAEMAGLIREHLDTLSKLRDAEASLRTERSYRGITPDDRQ